MDSLRSIHFITKAHQSELRIAHCGMYDVVMAKRICWCLSVLYLCISNLGAEQVVPHALRIYDEDGDRIFENLDERMQRATATERIPALIVYRDETPVAGTYAMRLAGVGSDQINRTYTNFPMVAARLTVSQIEAARKDPYLQQIELDGIIHMAMDTAKKWFGVEAVREQFGITGNTDGRVNSYSRDDVVIAIADTGINANHPDLRGKVLYWKDYVGSRPAPYDDQGHGTHVAGVAAGSGKLNPALAGVAPQAALVVFKILDSSGNGALSDGIAAVDEAITRRVELNIRILNFSLATQGSSAGEDAFSLACNSAVGNGIVVVAAAGNSGPGSRTIGAPAAATQVITVGAGADVGEKGFFLADFSSRGPTADGRIKPDLWAPGVNLRSPRKEGGYSLVSGTSFSAPFVSGVVGLMLEANIGLKPAGIKSILRATALHWAPNNPNNEAGTGRLQAYQAVMRAGNLTQPMPPAVPDLKFQRGAVGSSQTQTVTIPVAGTFYPIAATLVILNYPSADLDIDLVSPSGTTVAQSHFFSRQETLTFKPSAPGSYKIIIKSNSGSSSYLLDVSADLFP